MPTQHGPFVVIGDDVNDLLRKAHEKAQSLAPAKRGKVSTRFDRIGTTEDERGFVKAWGEYTVKEED